MAYTKVTHGRLVSIPYQAGRRFKRAAFSENRSPMAPQVSIPYQAGRRFKPGKRSDAGGTVQPGFNPLSSGA